MADPYRDAIYRQLMDQPQTFRGAPPPAPPPVFGQEFFGPKMAGMVSMFMPSLMMQFQQSMGGIAGSFSGNRDLYSVYESNKFATDMTAARFKAARDDSETIYTQFSGINRALNPGSVTGFDARGRPTYSPAMEAQLRNQTNIASQMMPVLASFAPDAVDSFGGKLGLRSTAIQSFMEATRFLPNERGRAGGIDASRVADSVFKDIYADDTSNAVGGMRSVRVGQLYDSLVRSGNIGGGNEEQVAKKADDTSNAVGGMRSVRVGQLYDSLVRSGNIGGGNEEQVAKKAGEAIKAHAAKVQAINDLFSENGLDNAPMDVLMRGLEKLTMTTGTASEAKVAGSRIRRIQEATRTSGLQFSEILDMSNQYSAQARSRGIRAGVYGEAVLDSVSYAQAFAKLGYGAIGKASSSTLNRAEYMAADAQLRMDAGASGMANLVGAVLSSSAYAKEGSEFAALAESIKKTGTLPEFMSGGDAMGRLAKMAEASGISGQVFQQQVFYGQYGNIEALEKDTSGAALRAVRSSGQGREYDAFLRSQLSGAAASMGVSVDDLIRDLSGASGSVDSSEALVAAVGKKYGKSGGALQELGTALSVASTRAASDAGLEPTSKEARDFAVINRLRLMNPDAIKAAGEARKDLNEGAVVREALGALGRDDAGRRLFEEFASLGRDGPADPKREKDVMDRMMKAVSRIVGVVPEDAVRQQLQGMDRKALAELSANPRTGPLVDGVFKPEAGAGAVGGGAGAAAAKAIKDAQTGAAAKAIKDAQTGAADNDRPMPVKLSGPIDLNININGTVTTPGGGEIRAGNLNISATTRGGTT